MTSAAPVAALALAIALLAACSDSDGASERQLADPVSAGLETGDRLSVADQRTDGSHVLIDEVSLTEGSGYVAVYADGGGAPGARLGASALLGTGSHDDVVVPLDDTIDTATTVFAIVHGERSNDDVLTWPGEDEPLADDGGVLSVAVDIQVTR